MINVIYIPGIGDHRSWFQDKIIKLWRIFGIRAEFHAVGWATDEPFEDKLLKLTKRIDELSAGGQAVALVGISAGASAAMNAYSARRDKIMAVVFICGKVYGTNNINPSYFMNNPSFKDSIFMADAALAKATAADKRKLYYLYCQRDRTVGPIYNRIPGVEEKKIFGFGHISGIYLTIVFHGRLIAKFIKSRSKISD